MLTNKMKWVISSVSFFVVLVVITNYSYFIFSELRTLRDDNERLANEIASVTASNWRLVKENKQLSDKYHTVNRNYQVLKHSLEEKLNNLVDLNTTYKKALTSFDDKVLNYHDINIVFSFLPSGSKISSYSNGALALAKGDINLDDINDLVAVIEDGIGDRKLVIFYGDSKYHYHLAVISESAIMSYYSGGGFGNPLTSISVSHGKLLINYYGGSSERFFQNYEFHFIDDKILLTYAETGWYLNKTNGIENDKYSKNYLTGLFKHEVGGKIISERIETAELKPIRDFEPSFIDFPSNKENR